MRPEVGIAILKVGLVGAVGCVAVTYVSEEYTPDWLKGKNATLQIEDKLVEKCAKVIERGRQALIEVIGQELMDVTQTPEGIAATAGNIVGLVGRIYYGVTAKVAKN